MTKESLHGWLNIFKPLRITSSYTVLQIKKQIKNYHTAIFDSSCISDYKVDQSKRKTKVGHAGTLDEMADGVLPVAIGQATRLVEYTMDYDKAYIFTVQFGTKTTTADQLGDVIATSNTLVSAQNILQILKNFKGETYQTPHKYSAIKVNGRRAYDLARSNINFELNPRIITIHSIKMCSFDEKAQKAVFKVECSKGTYIRSLAEDIAEQMGTLGFVTQLTRTRVGPFNISNSICFKKLDYSLIYNVDIALMNLLQLHVDQAISIKILNGVQVKIYEIIECDKRNESTYKIYTKSFNKKVWLSLNHKLVSIGKIRDEYFISDKCFYL